MTKKQYLAIVEKNIQALTAEERKEALEYYSNYFDDADDDDKVIDELGDPETLARTIVDNFECVPAKITKKKSKKTKGETEDGIKYETVDEDEEDKFADEEKTYSEKNEFDYSQEKMLFEFQKTEVVNLGIVVGAGQFCIKSGKTYKVETKGISKKDFRCEINDAGTLIIENKKIHSNLKKYGHSIKNKWCPRVLITVPADASVENLKLSLGAGQLTTSDLSISAEKTIIDLSAGELIAEGITSQSTNIRCSMGSIDVSGTLKGYTKIDCIMGSIKVRTTGTSRTYSCDTKIGMGTVHYGDEKRNGFSEIITDSKKKNHFFVKVGMGDVKISFGK